MYIDYAILGVISLAMCVYAYYRCPEPGSSDADDGEGGIEAGGDSSPTDRPPVLGTDQPTETRDRTPVEA